MFTDQITTPTFIDDIALALTYFFTNQPTGIYHLVASSFQSPYELALAVAKVFGFDPSLVLPGSLTEFLKTQPPDSRPWQKNLALSNQKITSLSIPMKTLAQGLETLKNQLATNY
jgi:dTDP-4-dehydrorhamnose reductase